MKTGYINGSDMLIKLGGKAVGHCTTHSADYTAETKARTVKPVRTVTEIGDGLWEDKSVGKLSITINFNGLRNYDETEGGFKSLLDAWHKHQPVEVESFERGEGTDPYLVGMFIISSLKEDNPAGDDAQYSGTLENAGKPKIFAPANLTGEEITGPRAQAPAPGEE